NVNSVTETMNAMEAARSYEANITAIEATKAMMSAALRLLA
ncbi:MAG: flagellar basal body rod C-terminal domain-containing protein, partial [Phycisphaerales bacterium]